MNGSRMKIKLLESDLLETALTETITLHERIRKADPRPVLDAAAAIVTAIRQGCKLLLCGNGGSAADAQHVAAEFVGDRKSTRLNSSHG